MHKRSLGQAAVEYLTTYGWMFLAVSIVGGTIYTQIDERECTTRVEGMSPPFPVVDEVFQYDNETVLMNVRNPDDREIELEEIVIKQNGSVVGTVEAEKNLRGESDLNINTNRFSSAQTCKERGIELNYRRGNLRDLTTAGKLIGKLDLVPLNAVIEADPVFVDEGEEVTFNASESEAEKTIEHYNWSFGDGNESTGEEVTHSYGSVGRYTVELTIEDSEGLTASDAKDIFVGGVLTRVGGTMENISVAKSVITRCIGDKCNGEFGEDDTIVTTNGFYLEGKLNSERFIMLDSDLCVTDYASEGADDGCKTYREGEENPVDDENNEIFGSVKIPTIEPNGTDLCFGNC